MSHAPTPDSVPPHPPTSTPPQQPPGGQVPAGAVAVPPPAAGEGVGSPPGIAAAAPEPSGTSPADGGDGNGNGNGNGNGHGNGDAGTGAEATGPQPTAEHDRLAEPVNLEEPPRLPFPVVGIGASAGGLEAFSEFFEAMRPDSGIAFVLVQHLPPERESLLADLLGKRTRMTVLEVQDGQLVEPDHVYVIRPGRVLTIKDGRLHLGEPLGGRRVANRPVDDFFKSLAEEQRERAVAIILFGAGSNGTVGLQAIKAVGGLCLVQNPESAAFPSMPRHALDQGYADYILAPAEMPEVLLQYVRHPYASGWPGAGGSGAGVWRDQQSFNEVLAILRTRVKQDFGGYKKPTVYRRIQRRMGLNQVFDLAQYARQLRQNPAEVQALADDLLIHVTGFFRDADAWESLRKRVVEPLVAARESESTVRCWVTACSSGEEAYSLAILLAEAADAADKVLDIKVFATDMAERSLMHARAGVFPGGIETEVAPERLERFFERDDSLYRVRRELREMVVFAPQNVLQDPPFSKLDIVTCRNLLIYLEPEVQRRVLGLLHFGLRDGGALLLGTSETVGGSEDLFEPVDKKWRIFRRVGPSRSHRLDFPVPRALVGATDREGQAVARRLSPHRPTVPQLTERTLLDRHTPAAVAVDRDHRILYYHGDTNPYLTQPRGEPTRDLMALAREEVRGTIRTALHNAMQSLSPATARDGTVKTDDGVKRVYVTAAPLEPTGTPNTFLVTFDTQREPDSGLDGSGAGADDASAMRDELARVRDELQSTIEELQTSNEELKASNEEVTSINEELQSTNEELETSKEELQSLNEELTTVNAQLQAKMEEHEAASNDLSSLLSSTDIGVIFLDTRFRIRRFTPAVKKLMDMIPSDVGRPLSDLARRFDDPKLAEDAKAVLDSLVPTESEVASEDGRWYLRRALPYRTADNRIDGVVITFVDVTDRREAEAALATSEERFKALVRASNDALYRMSPDWGRMLQMEGNSFLADGPPTGQSWVERYIALEDRPRVMAAVDEAIRDKRLFELEHRVRLADGAVGWTFSRAVPVLDRNGRILEWYGVASDITARKRVEEALRAGEALYRAMAANLPNGALFVVGPDLRYRLAGGQGLRDAGLSAADFEGRTVAEANPPAEAAELARAYRSALAGEPFRREHAARGRQYVSHGVPLRDDAGRVDAVLVVSYDLTDLKKAEAALRVTEERFRVAVAAARLGFWDWDVPAGTVTWEPVHNLMLGLPEGQTVGTPQQFMARVHPEDRPAVEARLAAAVADDAHFEAEFRAVHPDGAVRWIAGYGRPVASAGGKVTRMIGGTLDITDRKSADQAVREGRERFQLLVEGARDFALILLDPDNKVITWNAGAERLLGYAEPEALGRDAAFIFTAEDQAAGAPRAEVETAARDGRAIDERWHVRKNGSRFWAGGVLHAVRRPDGSIRGFVKVLRDETDRKRDQEALKAAKQAAEAATQVKDEFLATLSHELRTPLSAILLWSKMLQTRGGNDPAQLTEGLSAIRNSAEAQRELIDDLLDVTRITTGKLRVQLRPVELTPVIKDAVDAIGPTAEAKGVTVAPSLGTDIGLVRADPDRLRQVVWNLLTNAVKFTPAGGTVTVSVRRVDSVVEIRVADTGRGMDAEFLPHAFDRFRQAESPATRTEGGLGLGLAICKQLVELHGGTVRAESPGLGKGSTFVARLPLPRIRKKVIGRKVAVETPEPEVPDYDLTGVEVLLVEDDADNRRAVASLLRQVGAVVTEAETAAAGWEAFQRARPDVIVSDIGLPGEDGYALLGRIREREAETGATPVPAIALTAFARDQDRQRATEAGFQQHVGKPVEPEQLLASVGAAVAEP